MGYQIVVGEGSCTVEDENGIITFLGDECQWDSIEEAEKAVADYMPVQPASVLISFPAGTLIHCNRCDVEGRAPRAFVAVRENSRTFRMNQDMMTNPSCGHMDSHWVYTRDRRER